ncbi:MAG: hypothetical protein ACODAA_04070 [Gemmatimonadota bacterium]
MEGAMSLHPQLSAGSRGRSVRVASPVLTLVLVLLLSFLAGCADTADGPSVTVADSAGVRVLTAHGEGWGPADAWRLELDLEVGAIEGSDAFGRVLDVAPRRGGGFWVVDAQDRRVRGFDEEGGEVLAFGRAGMGPGEFKSAGPVGEDPEGRLTIGGRMPVELYRFDASGEPLDTRVVPPERYRDLPEGEGANRPPLGPTMAEWRFASDGSPFLQAVTLDAPVEDIVRSGVLLRLETPARPGVKFAAWETPALTGGPGGEMHLLQPAPSWSPLADGGVWFTGGSSYDLRRYDADGGLTTILRRPDGRIDLTDDLADRFLEALRDDADTPGMRAMLERAVFPDSLPATVALWASEGDGHLWVGVIDPELPLRREGPNALEVFAPDGSYVGRLPIPEGLRPTRITSRHLYGVWRDELDVDYARRYRIVRPS